MDSLKRRQKRAKLIAEHAYEKTYGTSFEFRLNESIGSEVFCFLTGHGPFASHSRRFNHHLPGNCRFCGFFVKTAGHLLLHYPGKKSMHLYAFLGNAFVRNASQIHFCMHFFRTHSPKMPKKWIFDEKHFLEMYFRHLKMHFPKSILESEDFRKKAFRECIFKNLRMHVRLENIIFQ